jgi:hypothetical protein
MRWSPGQPENALAGGNPLDYLAGQIRPSRDLAIRGTGNSRDWQSDGLLLFG